MVVFSIAFNSCNHKDKQQFRFFGYIYNSNDSTPFTNTNFKLWKGHDNASTTDKETFFTTDSKGYFDITNDGLNGVEVAWPSYINGAGYFGPPIMTPKSQITSSVNKIVTLAFDTLYTTPYH